MRARCGAAEGRVVRQVEDHTSLSVARQIAGKPETVRATTRFLRMRTPILWPSRLRTAIFGCTLLAISVTGRAADPLARGPILLELVGPERVFHAAGGGYAAGFALLAPGRLADGAALALESASGRRFPVYSAVTGRHADGSVRGLRLGAWLPRDIATRAGRFELVTDAGKIPQELVRIADGELELSIETGGTRFEFARHAVDPLLRISRRGVVMKDPSRPLAFLGRFAGSSLIRGESTVVLVDTQPQRAVVEVRTPLATTLGDTVVHASARFEFRAGIPGAEFTIHFTAATSGRFSNFAMALPLRRVSERDGFRSRFLPGDATDVPLGRGESASVLALDGETLIAARGESQRPLDSAARCGIALAAPAQRGNSLAVVGSRMRPLAPRSIEADATGVMTIVVLREETFLEAGTPIRFDGAFVLTGSDDRTALLSSLVREEQPALYGLEEGALDSLRPLAADPRDPNDPLAKAIAALDRGISALRGWRDYGDHRLGRGFANLEFDVALAIDLHALGSGDARQHTIAKDARTHFVLHDVSRGESGAPLGIPWRHGDDHCSHEFDPGHVFLGGLAVGALIDDDPALTPTLRAAVEALTLLVREGSALERERDFAWSAIAFSDARLVLEHATVAEGLERTLEPLLAAQAPRGFFAIDHGGMDEGMEGPRGVYAPTPWITGGLTLEALYRAFRDETASTAATAAGTIRISDASESMPRRIEHAVRRSVEFLLVDARYENGEFAARVGYDAPGKVVLERKGVADPIDRLHIAAGIGRAAIVLADTRLADAFEREIAVGTSRLKRLPLSPNEAARLLVAWRSIVDTRARLANL